jgi:hypothetical protein
MNPFRWPDVLLMALAANALAGALAGTLVGYVVFQLPTIVGRQAGLPLAFWLQHPLALGWWPWPLFGACIFGLSFYSRVLAGRQ